MPQMLGNLYSSYWYNEMTKPFKQPLNIFKENVISVGNLILTLCPKFF